MMGISFRGSAIRDFSGYPVEAAQRGAAGPGKDRGEPRKGIHTNRDNMMGISFRGVPSEIFLVTRPVQRSEVLQGRKKIAAPLGREFSQTAIT